MSIRVINSAQVRQLLPIGDCIDAMQSAMLATSTGKVVLPPRQVIGVSEPGDALLVMPVFAAETGAYGAKIISFHADNPAQGLPVIQGFVALFDFDTGSPVAFLAGAEVTAIRTAAASGLATRLLAREESRSCGIFGTGVQAGTHIDAMLAARPIEEFLIWGRNPDAAKTLAAEAAQRTGVVVRAVDDPAQAGACDVVCTVTATQDPILRGDWVADGAHINLVGGHSLTAREADTALIRRARLYTDSMESCRNEGGDYAIPIAEGSLAWDDISGEIGQLLAGAIEGRRDDHQVTVYNSLGIASQDLFAASLVYRRAIDTNTGVSIEL